MDNKFITKIQGKDFVTFEGLLNEFHENEGTEIYTKIVNTDPLIIQATVKGGKGTYQGIGDADETNVNKLIAVHKIRMAETRAIARALRWYNNIGMCSADEIEGESVYISPRMGGKPQNAEKPRYETSVASGGASDDDKPWITDDKFKEAIKKLMKSGHIVAETSPEEAMKLLWTRYKVAKKYKDMVQDEIFNNLE